MFLDLCCLSFHIQFKILAIQLKWILFALIEKLLVEFSSALTLENPAKFIQKNYEHISIYIVSRPFPICVF